MLLPSALPCDPRPALRRHARHTGGAYLATQSNCAPAQPSHLATGISSTCRALHALLGVQPSQSHLNNQTRNSVATSLHTHSKVKKRPPPPPRGYKRRRDIYEGDENITPESLDAEAVLEQRPSTPKRQRLAPPSIPFGLERSDFYNLQTSTSPPASSPQLDALTLDPERTPRALLRSRTIPENELELVEEDWSEADDSMLIEMVLDKLRLSRSEWDACARAIGTDQKSLGRRWKYLVDEGQVGLKFRRGGGVRRKRPDVRDLWR